MLETFERPLKMAKTTPATTKLKRTKSRQRFPAELGSGTESPGVISRIVCPPFQQFKEEGRSEPRRISFFAMLHPSLRVYFSSCSVGPKPGWTTGIGSWSGKESTVLRGKCIAWSGMSSAAGSLASA